MKQILFSICLLVYCLPVTGQDIVPEIEWQAMEHDFGQLTMEDTVSHHFYLKNTGNDTLRISGVTSSCGCTVAFHSDGPILQGEAGVVIGEYVPKEPGPFHEYLTVISNTKEFVHILEIYGTVLDVNPQKE